MDLISKPSQHGFDQENWTLTIVVIYPKVFIGLSEDVVDLLRGMLTVSPKKRMTLKMVYEHTWVNIDYPTQPLDYKLDKNREVDPVIPLEFVEYITKASVCEAGCRLMEELQRGIPSRKLSQEMNATEAENTSSNGEEEVTAEAERFLSKMTIDDKKKGVWWKRILVKVSQFLPKTKKYARETFPQPSPSTQAIPELDDSQTGGSSATSSNAGSRNATPIPGHRASRRKFGMSRFFGKKDDTRLGYDELLARQDSHRRAYTQASNSGGSSAETSPTKPPVPKHSRTRRRWLN